MSDELVRVRFKGVEMNVGRSFAESKDLNVLDESPTRGDGTPMPTTREGGRRRKPKTSVAKQAAARKAAPAAAEKAVTPASNEKE